MTRIKMSLIELAKKDKLPKHQYIDAPTLKWAKQNGQELLDYKIDFASDVFFELKRFDKYLPPSEWFEKEKVMKGIHGFRHIMRVCVNSKLLLSELEKESDNLLIAASLHDVRRVFDREDSKHGVRAANWFEENVGQIEDYYEVNLSPEDVKEIYYAIKFHAFDYQKLSDSEEYKNSKTIVDLLKTADSLDRFRLPKLKWWIDKEYLKIEPSREIIAFGFKAFFYSEKFALSGVEDLKSIKKAINFIKNGEQ